MMSSSEPGASVGDAEAASLIAAEGALLRDSIPDENQQIGCFSCGKVMLGLFCHDCGQKNDDYRRSIWSLFSETFVSVFSLENRMWRTWLVLLSKPGQVSREFSDGKRTKWTSPVRIYLALSILLFGYMSLTETRMFSIRTDIVPKSGFIGAVEDLDDAAVELVPDFGFFKRQAELDQLNSETDFNRVARLMSGVPRQVFSFDGGLSLFDDLPTDEILKSSGSWPTVLDNQDDESLTLEQLRAQALDRYSEKIENILETYNNLLFVTESPETIGDRILKSEKTGSPLDISSEIGPTVTEAVKRSTRNALIEIDRKLETLGKTRSDLHSLPIELTNGFGINFGSGTVNGVALSEVDIQNIIVQLLRNPALLNEGISQYLPRIMFLMMPFAALIGLVFIRGRQTALLYDHLVHATYIHAVTFAFLLFLILFSHWTPLGGMSQVFLIGIAIYLPLSAKSMFKRGWFKTIFASYSIAALYGLTMFIVVTLLTAQSIINATNISSI